MRCSINRCLIFGFTYFLHLITIFQLKFNSKWMLYSFQSFYVMDEKRFPVITMLQKCACWRKLLSIFRVALIVFNWLKKIIEFPMKSFYIKYVWNLPCLNVSEWPKKWDILHVCQYGGRLIRGLIKPAKPHMLMLMRVWKKWHSYLQLKV